MTAEPDLKAQGAALIQQLGGVWHGARGMCLCPSHADVNPSLSVRVGDCALLFKCFGGCSNDQVVRAVARLDRGFLLRTSQSPGHGRAASTDMFIRSLARSIWDHSLPISGTLASTYLRSRGIATRPRALRFHPSVPLGPLRRQIRRPALVAAIRERTHMVAIQRIFLDPASASLAGDLDNPRRMLGRPHGGAVELEEPSLVLGLAEGVETALSAMIMLKIPVWASLGAERFHQITIPRSVEQLVLLPDNDRAGRLAWQRAREAYTCSGRVVSVMWPTRHNDWNDVLRVGRENSRDLQHHIANWSGSYSPETTATRVPVLIR